MQLFPNTTIKEFAQCEHAEFITVQVHNDLAHGICIHDEDAKKWFLVLDAEDERLRHRLILPERGREVKSFGSDWSISPIGPALSRHTAMDHPGALVQSREGVFLVGVATGEFFDPVLCRLDEPGVWYNYGSALGSFAYEGWRIHYRERDTQAIQKLAAKEPTSNDAE
ncbi:hypothetical protein [Shimia thalassica]|uniref:hypothetical protein n=1 Tax=Shimia thalassica TaxID=1715693 RepID=UPI0026E17C03|nr:hypothetical protein [Shimia thalassica]MDO6480960.1 hypothetical protein [Shimia thalassica]